MIGAEVKLPNANRAFYRVVAVDEKGKRSGPSDFAEAPRPVVYSRPVAAAKVGSEYRYALSAIRSLGDVRTRVVDGKRDDELLGPGIDRALHCGRARLGSRSTPAPACCRASRTSPARSDVVVTATIDREVRSLDAGQLSWGVEKVVSMGTARVGIATQKFTIDVAP